MDAVAAALERVAESNPSLATRAETALSVLLAGVRGSCWPDVAWRFSRLGAGGSPVEFSFTSTEPALRYTVEPAGPEVAAADRLPLSLELLGQVDPGRAVPAELLQLLAGAWNGAELAWGAWVGGRHTAEGSAFKLYAEVPPQRASLLQGWCLCEGPLLPGRRPRLEGIGFGLASQLVEFYYRADQLDAADLGALLRRTGLHARQPDLLGMLGELLGRPTRMGLPRMRYGFSIALDRSGPGRTVTLFCYTYEALGDDRRCRESVLCLADRHGWDFAPYQQVSAPLVGASGRHRHTVVAVSVASAGAPAVTVALSPPEPEAPGPPR
jgi:hypothetical protein